MKMMESFLKFYQDGDEGACVVSYRITGLTPGLHGFHMSVHSAIFFLNIF